MAKKSTTLIRCIDCKNADFMQWFDNPIIAHCHEYEERMVAESKHLCADFIPSGVKSPVIQHFDHYVMEEED